MPEQTQPVVERRSGIDRRRFSYTVYLPERRKKRDRRKATSQKLTNSEKTKDTPNRMPFSHQIGWRPW